MQVRIYQPPKTTMQSGRARSDRWLLEFEPGAKREIEPLMGWTSAKETRHQVRLWFDSREQAVAYAEKHALMYSVEEPKTRTIKPKAYADNFAFSRLGRWTH
jgi:hypothetical protein